MFFFDISHTNAILSFAEKEIQLLPLFSSEKWNKGFAKQQKMFVESHVIKRNNRGQKLKLNFATKMKLLKVIMAKYPPKGWKDFELSPEKEGSRSTALLLAPHIFC